MSADLHAALQGFERRLVDHGAPIATEFRAGLPDGEIETQFAPLALPLPSELRAWWRWRNGAPLGRGARISGDFSPLGVADAVSEYRHSRVILIGDRGEPADEPNHAWPVSFVPIVGMSYGVIACDCSHTERAPARLITWVDGMYESGTASLAEMVEWWNDAIDGGGWKPTTGPGSWITSTERLPPERRMTGLL